MDNYQEQQSIEEMPRVGIKPFEEGVIDVMHRPGFDEIESPEIPTPFGKLLINLAREKGMLHDDPEAVLSIDDNGMIAEGTDRDFYNKGYYHVSVHIDNPPGGPNSDLKVNLWTDNDPRTVSQDNVKQYGEGDNEDKRWHIAQRFDGKDSFWTNPDQNILKKINISVESYDAGGEIR